MANEDNTNIENNLEEQECVSLAKHCPNPDCFLYMKPQPNRTWCVECDSVLTY